MSSTAPEYLTTLRDGVTQAAQQWMDQSTTAWDQWARAWAPADGMTSWLTPGAARPPGPGGQRQGAGPRHDHGHGHGLGLGHFHEHGPRGQRRAGCGCGHTGSTCGCGCGEKGPGCGCAECRSGCGEHPSTCGCGECQSSCGCGDPCRCCVPDADVIVHARVGEVRVVPFHLRNPWRRERPVSLEVGPWHGCDGDGLTIRAALEEDSIVLAPCEDRVVRLLVGVRPTSTDAPDGGKTDKPDPNQPVPNQPDPGTKDAGAEDSGPTGGGTPAEAPTSREAMLGVLRGDGRGLSIGDVDGCATAYADVRFEGCARPQRVALFVLPAECDAVDVGCDCGCC
ncbi:hypothetical protein ABEG17_09995 [Pedococcus sp. KACC 23699]|uniref:Uncharacterized protein n=1 Tax=Pedococcus sp. KACC 23699 TaxID=3149228 RepID=A0AAU7JND5_9MICO